MRTPEPLSFDLEGLDAQGFPAFQWPPTIGTPSQWAFGPDPTQIASSSKQPWAEAFRKASEVHKWSYAWDLDRYDGAEQQQIDALRRRAPTKWMLEGKPRGGRAAYLEIMRAGNKFSQGKSREAFAKQDSAYRRKLRKTLAHYRERTREMLESERLAREATISSRQAWPLQKLAERGLAVSDLQAYWLSDSAKHFGKKVAVFRKVGAQKIGWTKLRPGDAVVLSSQNAAGSDTSPSLSVQGSLIDKSATRLRVAFDEKASKTDIEGVAFWRMDQGHNDIFERRIDQALEALEHDIDMIESIVLSGAQVGLSGCKIVDALLDIEPPPTRLIEGAFSKVANLQDWLRRRVKSDYQKLFDDPTTSLNRSQILAIKAILSSRVSLVQGPPGTGKTRTVAEAVRILKSHYKVKEPILLTAHTNVAVDNLAEGAALAGLRVVRAGPAAKTRSSLRSRSLEALAAGHPLMSELMDVRSHIAKLQSQLGLFSDADEADQIDSLPALSASQGSSQPERMSPEQVADLRRKLTRCYQRSYVLWQRITRALLLDADVICATAVSACSTDLMQIDFPVVFFDEGSMATEPSSLIPLVKGCRHLALIGDHKQLPPVVLSPEAKEQGLGLSLFERLIKKGTYPAVMLDEQFRMHPTISEFPNARFYEGKLVNAGSTQDIMPLKSDFMPDGQGHLSFVNHDNRERHIDDSIHNQGEAALVLRVIRDLLVRNPDLQASDIGIVTPYLSQVILLQNSLRRAASAGGSFSAGKAGTRDFSLEEIEVHTVDGFEGREKAAVIFSTVRSNEPGYVGFLADPRRLNVALTRAQRGLFVLGNAQTLEKAMIGEVGKHSIGASDLDGLRAYVEYVRERGLIVESS